MTQDLLTDIGEEYLIKNGFDGITVTVGVYNDVSDGLSETDDYDGSTGDITTEPTNTNYSTASVSLSAADFSGNWGVDNDSQFSFDFSDQSTSENVDTFFVLYTFQSSDTGDGSPQTHLIANPAMTQTRDIGSIDTLTVSSGNFEITVN
jgi:hypothetical protein